MTTTPPDHSPLVDRLVHDLRPVRVLPFGRLLTAWLLVQGMLLAGVAVMRPRPDIGVALGDVRFALDLVVSLVAGTYAGWLAARSAFPDRLPTRVEVTAAAAGTALLIGLYLLAPPGEAVSIGAFVHGGVRCLLMTFVLALVPWVGLVMVLEWGAPLRPAQAGAIAGAASLLLAAAGMRVMCAIPDRLHLVVWHALPVAVGACASAAVAVVLLRWRRRRPPKDAPGVSQA